MSLSSSSPRLPLVFEANRGQTDPRVDFVARGNGYTIYVTAGGTMLNLRGPCVVASATAESTPAVVTATPAATLPATMAGATVSPATTAMAAVTTSQSVAAGAVPPAAPPSPAATETAVPPTAAPSDTAGAVPTGTAGPGVVQSCQQHNVALRLAPAGIDPALHATGENTLAGTANYFLGGDASRWITAVPTYGQVTYHGVAPGIDLSLNGVSGDLEYSYLVAPGADVGTIRLGVEGALGLRLDAGGALLIDTAVGTVRQAPPVIYQQDGGAGLPDSRHLVGGHFALLDGHTVGFVVVAYDRSKPLVIDPVIAYSTFLGGGNGQNTGNAIDLDGAGNAYVVGNTQSTTFPTTVGAYDTTYTGGNNDAFVAKLNVSGTALVWSTYLGGTDDDQALGVAVDGQGNVFVTGATRSGSGDFPTTSGAYQPAHNGYGMNVFVTKVISTGTGLAYSTFVGPATSWGRGITIDGNGSAYVTGWTDSGAFPTTAGAPQTAAGGGQDAFLFQLSPDGHSLLYGTYLGGTADDQAAAVTIDADASLYVTGWTRSSASFPRANAYQGTFGQGTYDAFVTKVITTQSSFAYSTFLGGTGDEQANAITVDDQGSAYVTGWTTSPAPSFPTRNAYQSAPAGGQDVFLTKFSPDGRSLVYSTYLGGAGDDSGWGVVVGNGGVAYVTGQTWSTTTFPTVNAVQPTHAGGSVDAFVSALSADGASLQWSTYLGGNGGDFGQALAVRSDGSVFVTGKTLSPNFPQVNSAYPTFVGGVNQYSEAFVTKISGPPYWASRAPMPTARNGLATTTGADGRIYAFGGRSSTSFTDPGLTTAEVYDPLANTWTAIASMPRPRFGLAAVMGPDGRIYVLGGTTTAGGLYSNVDAYDPSTNTWTAVASMSTVRYGLAAAVGPDGRIYAIGGGDSYNYLSSVEAYNIATNTWSPVASMTVPRRWLTAATGADGRLYAMGGYNISGELTAVEAYSPTTNSWTSVASLPTARYWLSAAAGADGRLYAVGGVSASRSIGTVVEAYTPETNIWSAVNHLQTPRYGLGVAVGSDGRIYAIGGTDGATSLNSVEAFGPSLSLTQQSGSTDTTLGVAGSNLAANTNVRVYWGDQASGSLVGTGTTDINGALTGNVNVTIPPSVWETGVYPITIIDDKVTYPISAT